MNCPRCDAPSPTGTLQQFGGVCAKCLLDFAEEQDAPSFPNLEIESLLGQGGMGVVYKARQKQLGRTVALKVLSPQLAADPQFVERFTREARALAQLSHPNIVGIHDFGVHDGVPFLVMEFVDGTPLRKLLASKKLSPERALEIVPQICDALHYAHSRGVVHRDIKPENVLIDREGRVKIADFGLAKLAASDETRITRTHMLMGSPNYMAPEQVEKPHAVDHRADIFSLGVVFYEMLTGELPLGRFKAPSERAPVDRRLDPVVLKSLEKEPDDRYQSAGEVKDHVSRLDTLPQPEAASPKRPSSDRLGFGLALLSCFVALGMGVSQLVGLGLGKAYSYSYRYVNSTLVESARTLDPEFEIGMLTLFVVAGVSGFAALVRMALSRDVRHSWLAGSGSFLSAALFPFGVNGEAQVVGAYLFPLLGAAQAVAQGFVWRGRLLRNGMFTYFVLASFLLGGLCLAETALVEYARWRNRALIGAEAVFAGASIGFGLLAIVLWVVGRVTRSRGDVGRRDDLQPVPAPAAARRPRRGITLALAAAALFTAGMSAAGLDDRDFKHMALVLCPLAWIVAVGYSVWLGLAGRVAKAGACAYFAGFCLILAGSSLAAGLVSQEWRYTPAALILFTASGTLAVLAIALGVAWLTLRQAQPTVAQKRPMEARGPGSTTPLATAAPVILAMGGVALGLGAAMNSFGIAFSRIPLIVGACLLLASAVLSILALVHIASSGGAARGAGRALACLLVMMLASGLIYVFMAKSELAPPPPVQPPESPVRPFTSFRLEDAWPRATDLPEGLSITEEIEGAEAVRKGKMPEGILPDLRLIRYMTLMEGEVVLAGLEFKTDFARRRWLKELALENSVQPFDDGYPPEGRSILIAGPSKLKEPPAARAALEVLIPLLQKKMREAAAKEARRPGKR